MLNNKDVLSKCVLIHTIAHYYFLVPQLSYYWSIKEREAKVCFLILVYFYSNFVYGVRAACPLIQTPDNSDILMDFQNCIYILHKAYF